MKLKQPQFNKESIMKTLNLLFSVVVLVFCLSIQQASAQAQYGTISGTVTDVDYNPQAETETITFDIPETRDGKKISLDLVDAVIHVAYAVDSDGSRYKMTSRDGKTFQANSKERGAPKGSITIVLDPNNEGSKRTKIGTCKVTFNDFNF